MKEYRVTLSGRYDAAETVIFVKAVNEDHARRKAAARGEMFDIIVEIKEVK